MTSITRQAPTSEHTNEDSLTWRVTFNEAVQNVNAADFTITGPNSSTTLAVAPVTGMETTTYDVAAAGDNLATYDGTAVLGFASNHDIRDMAGNALVSTPTPTGTDDNSFVVDNTAPTLAISGLSGTITGPVTATFTFGEAVTGFDATDITVGNGAASAFTETATGTTWTALITPSGSPVTVDVAAGAATDRAGNGNTAATRASAAYTAPGVTLSQSSLTLTELGAASDAEKTYTVILDTDPGANVTITVSSNDTTAVLVDTDSDMAGDQSTLTFTTSDWSQAQTVTLRAVNDGDALAETVTITHAAAVSPTTNPYHQIDIDDVTATTVDAGHGAVLSKTALTVAENGGEGTYTIALKSQPSVSTGIVLTPIGDAATLSSSLFTFTSSNWRTAQTVTVTGVNDNIDNAGDARTVTINHSTSTSDPNYNGRSFGNVTVTVTDDDAVPVLANAIPDQAATAGTAFSYQVPANAFTDADGDSLTYSATRPDDTALPTWLTFTAGTRTFSGTPQAGDTGTVTVKVTAADGISGAASDTFNIVVSAAYGITITESGGTSVSEDGGTDSYTVVLNRAPSHSVTVTATAGAGTEVHASGGTAGATASLTFTTANWSQAQTITVTGVDDDIDNAGDARTVTIAHATSSTDGGYNITNAGTVSVTVTDDDTAGLAFSPDPASVNEGATGSYTVVLTSQPTADVTVTISGHGGSDLTIGSASLTFTSANWSAPQSVSLTAAEDLNGADDEITLSHAPSGGGYGSAQDKDLTVTIIDDENDTTAPTVTQGHPKVATPPSDRYFGPCLPSGPPFCRPSDIGAIIRLAIQK